MDGKLDQVIYEHEKYIAKVDALECIVLEDSLHHDIIDTWLWEVMDAIRIDQIIKSCGMFLGFLECEDEDQCAAKE